MSRHRHTQNTSATNPTTNKPDYLKIIKKLLLEHKELLASAIVILGIIISAFGYIYTQGYNNYFGVSSNWINTNNSSFFFKLILPLSVAIIIMLPNLIASLPLLTKLKTIKTIVLELFGIIITFTLLFCLIYKVDISDIKFVIIGFILIPLCTSFFSDELRLALDILVGFALSIISLGFLGWAICQTRNNPETNVTWEGIVALAIMTILIVGIPLIIWVLIKIDKKTQPAPTNNNSSNNTDTEEDKIMSRNITVIGTAICVIILSSIGALMLYGAGASSASQQKEFRIIKLQDKEYSESLSSSEWRDDLKEYDNNLSGDNEERIKELTQNSPFLQIVEFETDDSSSKNVGLRRITNVYVVISENDDNYLVMNAYTDYKTNELYIFKSEKREIEKKEQLVRTITFKSRPQIV